MTRTAAFRAVIGTVIALLILLAPVVSVSASPATCVPVATIATTVAVAGGNPNQQCWNFFGYQYCLFAKIVGSQNNDLWHLKV